MENIVKTCYIRMVYKKQRRVEYYHYEDVFFREPLRVRISKLAEWDCDIYCACQKENIVKIKLSDTGAWGFENYAAHSDSCKRYLANLIYACRNGAISAYMRTGSKVSVDFNYTKKARPSSLLLGHNFKLNLLKAKALSFSQFIAVSNLMTFIYRTSSAQIQKEAVSQARDVLFTMGSHLIRNSSLGDETEKRIDDSFLFVDQSVGFYGFYYGKILSIPSLAEDGNSKINIYVKTVGLNGRTLSFRVKIKEFMPLYDNLIDKEHAWICGFIGVKELSFDNAKGGFVAAKAATPLPGKTYTDTKQKMIVKEMRVFRLFCCNKAGMIDYDKRELDRSNDALAKGLKLYRPLVGISKADSEIMIYNENGEDELL